MDAADILCDSLFPWVENQKDCAEELEKLAQELEDHQRSSIAQVLGAAAIVASISGRAGGLASDSTAEKAGVYSSTFDKATELIKEDEKAGTSIQNQLRDLKDECGEAPQVSFSVFTVPALIIEEADTLCDSLFRWLENRKECAGELEKLAKEPEDVHQGSNIAQVLRASVSAEALTSVCPTSTAKDAGVSSSIFNKAIELIRIDEKVGNNIQELLRDLKDRCGGAPLGAHADELDCEVATLLMSALARSHMTPGGLAATEVSDFICQALRLNHFPEITSSLKVSAKEMVKDIELIGTKAAKAGSEAQGATGLGISLRDPLVKTEELVKDKRVTEASEFLKDSAREILEGQQKLKEQLDAMHEIIQKLFITKSLIEDLGEYSLSMTKKVQRIINYIKRTCRDKKVLSWLKGSPHQIEFVNLLRFFKKRLCPIPKDFSPSSRGHIHIVIVAHGGIVDQFMPAGGLVPTPNIRNTILYSPWNCAIDTNAAYAIAQGSIKPRDRAFFNIADCEPIPLPDRWNSMRRSQESRHNIPVILLSPLTPKEEAWRHFDQLMKTRGLEIKNRVIFPYLVPKRLVNAYGEIPLYMFIFLTSFILPYGKSATVHLAACLSLQQRPEEWRTQYAYTSDNMFMTVRIDDKDMKSELYRAFRSLFDTTKHGAGERPGAV